VSPKSGRAVSRQAGEPYASKLLSLPCFLLPGNGENAEPIEADIEDGFRLTQYFFDKHVWGPRGLKPPQARARLVSLLGS
jgi:DNA repair protein RecO (recombination protein O)